MRKEVSIKSSRILDQKGKKKSIMTVFVIHSSPIWSI